jgi:hypothetical protein
LLDLTFRIYRRNFLRLIGITLVVMGPMLAMNLLGSTISLTSYFTFLRDAMSEPSSDLSPTASLLSTVSSCANGIALLIGIFVPWMQGALIYCVIENILGRQPTWRETYTATRSRWGALWIGTAIRVVVLGLLLVPLVVGLYMAVIAGAIGSGALPISDSFSGSDSTIFLVGLLAFCLPLTLVWLAVAIFVAVNWSMIETSIVGEGVSGTASLGRSSELTKGYRLRLTGRLLIFEVMRFLVVTLPLLAVQTFLFGGIFAAMNGQVDTSPISVGVLIAATVVSALAQVLVEPLYEIFITLNYFDLRVRKENLDLQLKVAQLAPDTDVPAAPATGIAIIGGEQVAPATAEPPVIEPPAPSTPPPPAPPPAPVAPAPEPDLSTLTPAQRAGVLFNRLRRDGPSGELLNELGLAYQQIGDTFGALDAFNRARSLAPNDAAIAYNLALLQRDRRDFLAARRAMADYLRLETDPVERQKVLDNPALKEILP